ncbi:hypothetical protein QE429_004576 [Bacillus sp. SORGH_AS 510]|uniref:hypothetical protein n=1 Tax=Bacillus sp. SORGH_AS_0510 TaxID=3041771 RepID=UPI0027887B1C|nr:hypothetical protein [Bacillus sp. SORGH_AS_0510]MDQ1147749.1 hypothetical protein [Bacillus sp. SORGH_AS_0510]
MYDVSINLKYISIKRLIGREYRVKKVTVKDLVQKFSLNVMTGEDQLQKVITQSRVHRLGLEFLGHIDFFQQNKFKF